MIELDRKNSFPIGTWLVFERTGLVGRVVRHVVPDDGLDERLVVQWLGDTDPWSQIGVAVRDGRIVWVNDVRHANALEILAAEVSGGSAHTPNA